ncbi:MAG TPA: hypothetical protein VLB27_08285 [candidate division Zixibacteria bacterium]|nr:hypothetical protein [candidate division Zixibacteria bacterium]
MLIIREVFTAKPGQASKLARVFKDVMSSQKGVRILTDSIGEFNTVVMETEVADLTDYENRMKEYESGEFFKQLDAEKKAAMSQYKELYLTGRREVFRVID